MIEHPINRSPADPSLSRHPLFRCPLHLRRVNVLTCIRLRRAKSWDARSSDSKLASSNYSNGGLAPQPAALHSNGRPWGTPVT
jgi:hypothetical protein